MTVSETRMDQPRYTDFMTLPDFAAESTSLAKSQILQQASTAMLAQANASKQSVLSLLQG